MATADLIFRLIGHDKASPAFNSASKSAKKLDDDMDRLHKGLGRFKGAGAAIGAGLAGLGLASAGAAMKQFASESIKAFQSVGGESMKLQRLMGGSMEQASLLRGVAKLSGQDMDVFSKAMVQLSKNAVNNADKFTDLGISVTDAAGAIRPTSDLLKDVSGVFAKMPNGAEKTALAVSMFGRAGADLLPFLNRGSEGIAELEAKTKQYGLALNDTDQNALKRFTAAQREMQFATEGAKVTLGRGLFPVMSQLQESFAKIAVPLTQAVTPAFQALGEVAVLAVDELAANLPAVQALAMDVAEAIKGVASGVKNNWPAIKDTIATIGDTMKRVSDIGRTLWDAFRALPPEVQTTLATLAVLQKTGVIQVAFSAVNAVKDLFAKVTGMNVTAGHVSVNGPAGAVPGGAAGKAGAAGAGSSAMTLAGVNVPAVVAAVLAAGTVYAVHQMVTGGAVNKVKETGGNPATLGGSWQAMGAAGTTAGTDGWIKNAQAYRNAVDLAAIAQDRLNKAVSSGVVSAGQLGAWAPNFQQAMIGVADAAGVSGDELKTMGAAIAAIPPGASVVQVEDAVRRFGRAAGMTDEEIKAMSATIVGIPGGATVEQLIPAMRSAGIAAGATASEVNQVSAAIAGIPGGATVEQLGWNITRAGEAAGLTQAQMQAMTAAIGAIPPGSNADFVTASVQQAGAAAGLTQQQIAMMSAAVLGIPPGTTADEITARIQTTGAAAGLTQVEIQALTAAVLGIPPTGQTAVSAPGAVESTSQLYGTAGAANSIPNNVPVTVTVYTGEAYAALNSLAAAISAAKSSGRLSLNTLAAGGPIPGLAPGGRVPVWVSNGEYYASPGEVAKMGGIGAAQLLNSGMIYGPGGPTSDSILGMAEPGGFVFNAKAARGFASGGSVGGGSGTVQLVLDGRVIHESLLRLRRDMGGAPLGLA